MKKETDNVENWTFGNGITMVKIDDTYTYTLPATWPGSLIPNYISTYTLTENATEWTVSLNLSTSDSVSFTLSKDF